MSYSLVDRAQVLAEALPYIQKYNGKTIVVKYGGNAMVSEELRQAVISDIVLLSLVGIHVVVVHGGGPEINEILRKIGKQSRFVDGLRYTDAETMDVVQQVLCGKVNKDLVALIDRRGGRAVGLCGMDGSLFQAAQLDPKYGLVGEILVCEKGTGLEFDEELAKKILSQDEVVIDICLNEGDHEATCWGCDLTYDYVKINGDYRS